jgi:[ribosomal protein S18]-alanine N-acetyltransferase
MTPQGGEPVLDDARPDDIEALVAIDANSPRPWNTAAFETELKNRPPTLLVLRLSAAIAFVVTRVQLPDMDIVNLTVSREHRRRGFARRLLASLLDRAGASGIQNVFLEVRAGNNEARSLYAAAGFQETQRRRGFYQDPVEDAILMRLQIGPERG